MVKLSWLVDSQIPTSLPGIAHHRLLFKDERIVYVEVHGPLDCISFYNVTPKTSQQLVPKGLLIFNGTDWILSNFYTFCFMTRATHLKIYYTVHTRE